MRLHTKHQLGTYVRFLNLFKGKEFLQMVRSKISFYNNWQHCTSIGVQILGQMCIWTLFVIVSVTCTYGNFAANTGAPTIFYEVNNGSKFINDTTYDDSISSKYCK